MTRQWWIEKAKRLRQERYDFSMPTQGGDNFRFVMVGGLGNLKLWRRDAVKGKEKGISKEVAGSPPELQP